MHGREAKMHPVTITSLLTGNVEPFPADTATSWAGHLSIAGLTYNSFPSHDFISMNKRSALRELISDQTNYLHLQVYGLGNITFNSVIGQIINDSIVLQSRLRVSYCYHPEVYYVPNMAKSKVSLLLFHSNLPTLTIFLHLLLCNIHETS